MFSELEKHFYAGNYEPLPNHVFPITEVVEAFRFMAAGKHIGKNVLDFDVDEIQIGRPTEEGNRFRSDGTYLITGGAGGFGLELAQWMHKNGARHFALMSRSGPKEEDLEKVATLSSDGGTMLDIRGDVTKTGDVKAAVSKVQESDQIPLIGVIHGAMVLNDEFIVELDEEGFDSVLLPKMLGAWNLHEETLGIELEDFICFLLLLRLYRGGQAVQLQRGKCFSRSTGFLSSGPGIAFPDDQLGSTHRSRFCGPEREDPAVSRNGRPRIDQYGGNPRSLQQGNSDLRDSTWLRPMRLAGSRPIQSFGGRFRYVPARGAAFDFRRWRLHGSPDSRGSRPDKRMGMVEDLIATQVGAVLGTDAARIDKDTPLTNLGLDSLMAIELVNRIEDKLGMSMPMGSVLNGPNIRDLSIPVLEKLLESAGDLSAGGGTGSTLELVEFEATGEMPEVFPLSEGQKALWFLNRLAPDSSAYNLVFSGKFRPLLDHDAMKKAFALIFERHPMFDVTFSTRDGEPVQTLHHNRAFDFREHDCSNLDDDQLKDLITEHANRPFNLERGPVVRLELFKTADNAHVALLSMHHIVSDAWSVAVMMQDLIEYYFSFKAGKTPKVEPQAASFADYVHWEIAHLESSAGDQMLAYWKDHLAGAPNVIDLPTDRPRPAVQTFNGGTYGFQLDEALTESVETLSKESNVTLFTTLLSAYDILLHRYCQQDDIVVGVPLAGRSQPELQSLVGYFINPVPVRSTIEEDPTVAEYLTQNRDHVNGALENQHYPMSRLVERLQAPRDPGRSPTVPGQLFDGTNPGNRRTGHRRVPHRPGRPHLPRGRSFHGNDRPDDPPGPV